MSYMADEQISNLLAKKYAKAFLRVFSHEMTYEDLNNLMRMSSFFKQEPRISFLLRVPLLASSVKQEQINHIIDYFQLGEAVKKLFALLRAHKRMDLLPKVVREIITLYKKQYAILEFTITSAHPLSTHTLKTIREFLARHTKSDIIYEYKEDKQLIAGIRAQSTQWLWEHSIRKQLRTLMQLPIM